MGRRTQDREAGYAVPDENRRRIVRTWGRLLATVIIHYGEQSEECTTWLNCVTQVMGKEYTDELIREAMSSALSFTMIFKTVDELAAFGVPRMQQPDLPAVRREFIPDTMPPEKRSHSKWSAEPEPETEVLDQTVAVEMTATNPAMQFFTISDHSMSAIGGNDEAANDFNDFDPGKQEQR